LQRLRRQERWTRPQIETYQAQALHRLRTQAYTHSPFYQKFHQGLADKPLHTLPVLTKTHLHDHFDEIITDRRVQRAAVAAHVHSLRGAERFLDRYFVTATSGTTGGTQGVPAPGSSFFLFNHAEWATVLASFTRYERHIGSLWGVIQRPRLAVVASATPWHMSARIGATTRSAIIPMLRLDVGEPLGAIVRRLNAWQPQILATYASMAGILADEQRAGRLQIAPTRIVSSAEVLTQALRQRVEAVWGKHIVFNQYGATEAGAFAVECESHSGLHLFEDLVIFEVVDEQNRPVPPGVYGDKVLLTVLFNHTQPLIRYELTDSVRVATGSCPCGCAFTLLDDIQGRLEEVLRFPTQEGGRGEAGTVAVHPMVFYRLLDATPVAGWQVVQEPDRLSLRLGLGGAQPAGIINEAALVEAVRRALAQQGAVTPPITVQWLEGVTRGATGKAARIISTIKDRAIG
jgi:phenylacetate-coenzyme A ligase PaaK-like adenylate-forming protein